MADGDYERTDARVAELRRLEGILRAVVVRNGRSGSISPQGLRPMRDVVEEMAKRDRG